MAVTEGTWNNDLEMRLLAPILLSLALGTGLQADVQMPTLFGDHMVMQSGSPIHVWGLSDPNEEISVTFRGQRVEFTASDIGMWETYLDPAEPGGPYVLEVEGNNEVRIEDIHLGEVWIGSGQSNMVWPLERSDNADEEIANAKHPGIRYFKVDQSTSDLPLEDVGGQWRVVSPDTAAEFSGVAYFFARHIHQELGVPVGVIQTAWGGTPAEAWTRLQAIKDDRALSGLISSYDRAARLARSRRQDPRLHHKPSALFNAMIAPLTPYPIRGVIWYQGENNGNRGQGILYRQLFRTLIQDWRAEWGIGDFPFLFVQLASYGRVSSAGTWPELREAQSMALGLANTGMAVTIDIGESDDIHPRNKQDVGLRLALAARRVAYGEMHLEHSGPIYRQATWEGSEVRLWFDHTAEGLEARDGPLRGFEVAGANGGFYIGEARISGNTVVVSNPAVVRPIQVRYAWAPDPDGNLFNSAGLPASPFRTMR